MHGRGHTRVADGPSIDFGCPHKNQSALSPPPGQLQA